MAVSRGDILNDAFEIIGLASYVFDTEPSEYATAFRRLDSMMAQFLEEGIDVGYLAVVDTPALGDDTGLEDWCREPVAYNLGMRLAPGFGRVPTAEAKRMARIGYGLLLAKTSDTPRLESSNTLRGGGDLWRGYRRPFADVTDNDAEVIYNGV